MSSARAQAGSAPLLDGRYRLHTPISEGVLLRELWAQDVTTGEEVAVWLPHRGVSPAFEDIESEIGLDLGGCRRVLDLGRSSAYIVGVPAEHAGPRPRRSPHLRPVIAGWFRAVAGIIDRNHRAGRWHGVLTCDDVAILGGKLVVAGFGFWVRTDPEAIGEAVAASGGEAVRQMVAPEVEHSAIGPAADLWALGRCTLGLATAAGAPQELGALARRHRRLAELLSSLLDPDPDRRTTDLRGLSELVTEALDLPFADEPGASRRAATAPGRPRAQARRRAATGDELTGAVTNVRTEALDVDDLELADDDEPDELDADSEFPESNTTLAEPPGPAAARLVQAPVAAPAPPMFDDAVDTAAERALDATGYEPGTGVWTGAALTAIDDGPGVVVPTPWSPLSSRQPIQVISMKHPSGSRSAPRPAARAAPIVPRIRRVELAAQTQPSPAALGRIAPPRALTQAGPAPRRWLMTALVIAVAIAALLFAAALLWS